MDNIHCIALLIGLEPCIDSVKCIFEKSVLFIAESGDLEELGS